MLKREEIQIIIYGGINNDYYVFFEKYGNIKISNFEYYTVNKIGFTGYLNDYELKEINNEVQNNRNNVSIYFEYLINNKNYILDIPNGFILEINNKKYYLSDAIIDLIR